MRAALEARLASEVGFGSYGGLWTGGTSFGLRLKDYTVNRFVREGVKGSLLISQVT